MSDGLLSVEEIEVGMWVEVCAPQGPGVWIPCEVVLSDGSEAHFLLHKPKPLVLVAKVREDGGLENGQGARLVVRNLTAETVKKGLAKIESDR